ncbi:hypothetical protein [Streptomyces sp. MUM 16J]|uniref:hypothetical protein n=1 Tax=Streptomyces sp. MUM 16J TaxID=2791988 RepID=UPI001F046579|nr:hypothetical protein [Streptomyces sp. MUM 16J]MCH0559314.1 hypothetical protein [Streptomyces sp. MUM 16J]
MRFRHTDAIWSDYPELIAGALHTTGDTFTDDIGPCTAEYPARAEAWLADPSEGQFPEVLAWRRAFARMGLRPTQYRCASESLLRRCDEQPLDAVVSSRHMAPWVR